MSDQEPNGDRERGMLMRSLVETRSKVDGLQGTINGLQQSIDSFQRYSDRVRTVELTLERHDALLPGLQEDAKEAREGIQRVERLLAKAQINAVKAEADATGKLAAVQVEAARNLAQVQVEGEKKHGVFREFRGRAYVVGAMLGLILAAALHWGIVPLFKRAEAPTTTQTAR